jgi:hypothetical protein
MGNQLGALALKRYSSGFDSFRRKNNLLNEEGLRIFVSNF